MVLILVTFTVAFLWYFLKTNTKSKTFKICSIMLVVALFTQVFLEYGYSLYDFLNKMMGGG